MNRRNIHWKHWIISVILASSVWFYGCSLIETKQIDKPTTEQGSVTLTPTENVSSPGSLPVRPNETNPSAPVEPSSENNPNKENPNDNPNNEKSDNDNPFSSEFEGKNQGEEEEIIPTNIQHKDDKEPNKEQSTTPVKEPLATIKAEEISKELELSMESLAKAIVDNMITKDMSEVEKVRAVHDYIVLNTEYDYKNLLADTIPLVSYQIEGVLVHKKAVCQGYAETFQLFMELLGIESKFVSGIDLKSNVGHAWNQVKLDGEWYHIDTTWDDPVPDQRDKVQYKYFLVTDEVLSADHSWDKTKFPESKGTKYRYHVYQEFIIDSIGDYEEKFIELYQQGNNEITILYPERGMPDMDFLGKYEYFYKEVDGRSVVTYGWYPTWRLGDYTVLTVFMK